MVVHDTQGIHESISMHFDIHSSVHHLRYENGHHEVREMPKLLIAYLHMRGRSEIEKTTKQFAGYLSLYAYAKELSGLISRSRPVAAAGEACLRFSRRGPLLRPPGPGPGPFCAGRGSFSPVVTFAFPAERRLSPFRLSSFRDSLLLERGLLVLLPEGGTESAAAG